MNERVQKILAQAGFGSRRACEEYIEQGRVRVNGVVIKLGDKADPATDVIDVDGQRISITQQKKRYIALNKPLNVLSTSKPARQDDRRTVYDLVPVDERLFMIGRLDAESEGLIVLTNDGDLANRLSHPRYNHTKTYRVVVHGLPSRETLQQWQEGIYLEEEGRTAPCYVQITRGDKQFTTLQIVMIEGRKRQIRRVAAQLGHPVHKLMRTHIGTLGLGSLRPGEWRELNSTDLQALKANAREYSQIRKLQKMQKTQKTRKQRK